MMLQLRYQKMNYLIFLLILFRVKKQQKHIRKKNLLVKYNILLHYQQQLVLEILFNYRVCHFIQKYKFENCFFRWTNYSITSKFIIKYCHYGCKLKFQILFIDFFSYFFQTPQGTQQQYTIGQ